MSLLSPPLSPLSLSTLSATMQASQRARGAKEVTTVSLTPATPYGPTWVRAPDVTVRDSVLGKVLHDYDDPLTRMAAERPMSGSELAQGVVDHMDARGQDILQELSNRLSAVMSEALGVPATDDVGQPVDPSDLRALAEDAGQPLLTMALDRFERHVSDFSKTIETLRARAGTESDQSSDDKARDGLVRRAIGALVDGQLEPERLRHEIDALRGAAILRLTGATEEDQQRALAFRRASGAVALNAKRTDMVKDMWRDYKSGRFAATVDTRTVWADQSVNVDSSRATGAVVTFTQTFDHYASATLALGAQSVSSYTLRMV